MNKLNAKELRKTPPKEDDLKEIKRNPIYIVADRIFDTYNIGSLFRLADAISAEKVFLCGDMEYPPSSKIHKSAVGTEEWVPWTTASSALQAVRELKKEGVQIIAVEQDPRSIPYTLLPIRCYLPCAIVVGHETDGVSKEVLDLSDIIVELPMFGVNKSFNVWGSAAIIAYKILESLE
ncbi:MAG: TrmH family RNA methyltransferase [Candidatus Woesebacteria bacterium]|nr:TrmH family RNA methyltransferase [Candidatus Woesebacteria bacterium]